MLPNIFLKTAVMKKKNENRRRSYHLKMFVWRPFTKINICMRDGVQK